MGWFGKKAMPALNALPSDDAWSVAQGKNNGQPMFVRVNRSAKGYAAHPELPWRLGVAVPLNAPNEHGLPGPEETAQLNAIEDSLLASIGNAGRLVLVITTGGMREFVSYISTQQAGKQIVQTVAAANRSHRLQHYVQEDKTWGLFGQFA